MAESVERACAVCSLDAARCREGCHLLAEVVRLYEQVTDRSASLPLSELLLEAYEHARAAYFVHCGL
jgi:hypothetical protein